MDCPATGRLRQLAHPVAAAEHLADFALAEPPSAPDSPHSPTACRLLRKLLRTFWVKSSRRSIREILCQVVQGETSSTPITVTAFSTSTRTAFRLCRRPRITPHFATARVEVSARLLRRTHVQTFAATSGAIRLLDQGCLMWISPCSRTTGSQEFPRLSTCSSARSFSMS